MRQAHSFPDFIRDGARRLHRDESNGALKPGHLGIGSRADAARVAVLENDHGIAVCLRQKIIQRGDIPKLNEAVIHRKPIETLVAQPRFHLKPTTVVPTTR